MGKSQRDKGYRTENNVRKKAIEHGVAAYRVPLSGGASIKGDVVVKGKSGEDWVLPSAIGLRTGADFSLRPTLFAGFSGRKGVLHTDGSDGGGSVGWLLSRGMEHLEIFFLQVDSTIARREDVPDAQRVVIIGAYGH